MSGFGSRVRIAVSAAWLVPQVVWMLRRAPVPRVRARLRLALRPSSLPTSAHARLAARDIARIVAGVARRIPLSTNCLSRGLIAEALLRCEGHAPRLVLGVRRDGRDVQAHAWVVCGGEVVLGAASDLDRFAALVPVRRNVPTAASFDPAPSKGAPQ